MSPITKSRLTWLGIHVAAEHNVTEHSELINTKDMYNRTPMYVAVLRRVSRRLVAPVVFECGTSIPWLEG